MFGRATITLGIGPHSSSFLFYALESWTRSIGTIQTLRLTSAAIWRMSMNEWMSINHFPYLPIVTYPDPSIQTMIRSPPKFNHLFIGHLPTFPANFMQICSEFFSQSCWQTDRQTDKQRWRHILLGGGKKGTITVNSNDIVVVDIYFSRFSLHYFILDGTRS